MISITEMTVRRKAHSPGLSPTVAIMKKQNNSVNSFLANSYFINMSSK